MIYIITFICSAAFAGIAQYYSSRERKRIVRICLIMCILIPSILGGLRADTVGTDNIVYKTVFYKFSVMQSPLEAIQKGQFEPLYNLLNYLVSRFTADYHWVCFFTEIITMTFIVLGLYKYKEEIPMWLGLLVYLFCQYCNVMNLVRQGIALSICFFAFQYAFEKKWIKYFAFVALAVLFHTSAYIAILIYFIFALLDGERSGWKIIALIVAGFAGLYVLPRLAQTLIGLGFLPSKYMDYISGGVRMSRAHTIYRLPTLLVATLLYRIISQFSEKYKYLYALLWMEMITVQIASIFDPAYRMSLYFSYASLLVIPHFPYAFKKNTYNIYIVYAIILIYLVAYWVFFTVNNGYGFRYPTYPFISDLL